MKNIFLIYRNITSYNNLISELTENFTLQCAQGNVVIAHLFKQELLSKEQCKLLINVSIKNFNISLKIHYWWSWWWWWYDDDDHADTHTHSCLSMASALSTSCNLKSSSKTIGQ